MMVNFATEAVFDRDAQGRVWAIAGFGDALWQDQLSVFPALRIVARVRAIDRSDKPHLVADPRIVLFDLPFYKGLRPFLRVFPLLVARLWQAAGLKGATLVRTPGPIGTLLALMLALRGRRFALQLVGDPYQVMSGGGFFASLRFLRGLVTAATRLACRRAAVISYVTQRTLQLRYPPGPAARVHAFSDIDLSGDWLVSVPRAHAPGQPARLFLCGSLAQLYKGVDILIEALAELRRRGFRVLAVIAGDGTYRAFLERLAAERGVGDYVTFLGAVDAERIKAELDRADIFAMPSRTEGMPRALIEAFARGVPAVASNVGGIPELLEQEEMVPVDDYRALADRIAQLLGDPAQYLACSTRNLERAQAFDPKRLRAARHAFYREVVALG